MQEKGPAWLVIFFLLVTFILLNTVSVEQATEDVEATLRTTRGMPVIGGITIEKDAPAELPKMQEGEIALQAITLQKNNDMEALFIIDIPYSWLIHHRIGEDTIALHHKADNESWVSVTIDEQSIYADMYTITTATPRNGMYLVSGIGNSDPSKANNLPSTKVQLGIILLVIIIILIIAYSNISFKKRKDKSKKPKKSKEEKLEGYIRKAIVEGKKDEEIKEQLKLAGWDEENIDQALRRARFF